MTRQLIILNIEYESLVVIQQLPVTLKRIDELLLEMRNKLGDNQDLIADNTRPER